MTSTRRKPTDVRRLEITEAVLRVIGERGATALKTNALAAEVGLTPGALFRHFPNLGAILEAAVDLSIQRMDTTFPSEDLPPLERLTELARLRVALLSTSPGMSWLLTSSQVLLYVPEAAVDRLRALVGRSRTFILGALREGVESKELRQDLRPEVLMVLFTGVVHALIAAGQATAGAGAAGTNGKGTKGKGQPPSAAEVLDALALILRAPSSES